MRMKNLFLGISAAALLGGAALAADAGVKAGAAVSDTSGNPVGTIESVNGDLAVVSTGTTKVSLPVSSFGQGAKGPILAMTKAELDAAASGAQANAKSELAAQLKAGASVYGSDGASVGTVESADAQFVTLNLGDQKAKLPLESFSKGAQGPVIGMTAAELKAAIGASGQQAAAEQPSGSAQN